MCETINDLVMPGVAQLHPYEGGKPVEELERELGISHVVKLASNENPLGVSHMVKDAILNAMDNGARYPDGNGFYLKQALAGHLSVSTDQLTLGNGSNDLLDLLARCFLGEGLNAVVSDHGFIVYQLVVTAQNAELKSAPANEWGHDLQAMAALVDENTRLLFVANPNNPTGTWLPLEDIAEMMATLPSSVIVVVDEAYFEYVGEPGYGSALSLLDQYPNLVVTRTFSKAYGLASLRVGYAISHPEVAEVLNRLRQPFNVNSFGLAAAAAALQDQSFLQNSIQLNQKGLQQIQQGLSALGISYIPSVGNFVAFEVPSDWSRERSVEDKASKNKTAAQALYELLLQRGVIVRPIGIYRMPHFLRVSIGLEDENSRFLHILADILASGAMS